MKNKLIISFDVILVTLIVTIPMIMYLNYLLRGAVLSVVLYLIWLFYVLNKRDYKDIFFNGIAKNTSLFFLLTSFLFINFFHYFFSFTTSKAQNFITVFILYLILTSLGIFYQESNKLRSIFFFLTIALGIQAAISIPYLLSTDILVSRMLASGQLEDTENIEAIKNGVGTNGLYISNVFIVALGLYYQRFYTKTLRIIFLSALVFIILSILMSTFFTPILLLLLV